jgi:hypothetical protein
MVTKREALITALEFFKLLEDSGLIDRCLEELDMSDEYYEDIKKTLNKMADEEE